MIVLRPTVESECGNDRSQGKAQGSLYKPSRFDDSIIYFKIKLKNNKFATFLFWKYNGSPSSTNTYSVKTRKTSTALEIILIKMF